MEKPVEKNSIVDRWIEDDYGFEVVDDGERADAEEGDWVTINGTHVMVGEGGTAASGGKLKGMDLSRAKSSNKKQQTIDPKEYSEKSKSLISEYKKLKKEFIDESWKWDADRKKMDELSAQAKKNFEEYSEIVKKRFPTVDHCTTAKDVCDYVRGNGFFRNGTDRDLTTERVDLTGVSFENAKSVAVGLDSIRKLGLEKYCDIDNVYVENAPSDTYAYFRGRSICLNKSMFSSDKKLKEAYQKGQDTKFDENGSRAFVEHASCAFHPIGCEISSIIAHEASHGIAEYLAKKLHIGMGKDYEFCENVFDYVCDKLGTGRAYAWTKLSKYAQKNYCEFFAEAMSCKICGVKNEVADFVWEYTKGCLESVGYEKRTDSDDDIEWITVNGNHIPVDKNTKEPVGGQKKAIGGEGSRSERERTFSREPVPENTSELRAKNKKIAQEKYDSIQSKYKDAKDRYRDLKDKIDFDYTEYEDYQSVLDSYTEEEAKEKYPEVLKEADILEEKAQKEKDWAEKNKIRKEASDLRIRASYMKDYKFIKKSNDLDREGYEAVRREMDELKPKLEERDRELEALDEEIKEEHERICAETMRRFEAGGNGCYANIHSAEDAREYLTACGFFWNGYKVNGHPIDYKEKGSSITHIDKWQAKTLCSSVEQFFNDFPETKQTQFCYSVEAALEYRLKKNPLAVGFGGYQYEINERMYAKGSISDWNSGNYHPPCDDSGLAVTYHELAHCMTRYINEKLEKRGNGVCSEILVKLRKQLPQYTKEQIQRKISTYAMTDPLEFVSECFSYKYAGERAGYAYTDKDTETIVNFTIDYVREKFKEAKKRET